MPQSVIDCLNFIGRDQPTQAMFTDWSGNVIGDDDPTYENDPDPSAHFDTPSPGEIIPDVAPDNVNITGVDTKLHEDSCSPVKIPGVEPGIPGVEPAEPIIGINDIDISPPKEPP